MISSEETPVIIKMLLDRATPLTPWVCLVDGSVVLPVYTKPRAFPKYSLTTLDDVQKALVRVCLPAERDILARHLRSDVDPYRYYMQNNSCETKVAFRGPDIKIVRNPQGNPQRFFSHEFPENSFDGLSFIRCTPTTDLLPVLERFHTPVYITVMPDGRQVTLSCHCRLKTTSQQAARRPLVLDEVEFLQKHLSQKRTS